MSSALDELRLLKDHLTQIISSLEGTEHVVRPPMSNEANTEPEMNANRVPIQQTNTQETTNE